MRLHGEIASLIMYKLCLLLKEVSSASIYFYIVGSLWPPLHVTAYYCSVIYLRSSLRPKQVEANNKMATVYVTISGMIIWFLQQLRIDKLIVILSLDHRDAESCIPASVAYFRTILCTILEFPLGRFFFCIFSITLSD